MSWDFLSYADVVGLLRETYPWANLPVKEEGFEVSTNAYTFTTPLKYTGLFNDIM